MLPIERREHMTKAITNPQDKIDRDSKSKTDNDQYIADLKEILSKESGIRFFQRFFEDGYIFRTTFTGNSQSYFLEGARNYALKYFNDITIAAPEHLPKLLIRPKK